MNKAVKFIAAAIIVIVMWAVFTGKLGTGIINYANPQNEGVQAAPCEPAATADMVNLAAPAEDCPPVTSEPTATATASAPVNEVNTDGQVAVSGPMTTLTDEDLNGQVYYADASAAVVSVNPQTASSVNGGIEATFYNVSSEINSSPSSVTRASSDFFKEWQDSPFASNLPAVIVNSDGVRYPVSIANPTFQEQSLRVSLSVLDEMPAKLGRETGVDTAGSGDAVPASMTQVRIYLFLPLANNVNGCSVAVGTNCSGMDLFASDLSKSDLSGANFANANLGQSVFTSSSLNNANLTGAKLFRSDLNQVNATNATATNADLSQISAQGVIFNASNLDGSNLHRADLTGGQFEGAVVTGASWEDISAQNGNFKNSNFTNTSLPRADLRGADLSGANLSGVNLSYSDLTGANLTGANLTGTNLYSADINGANLTGAVFSSTTCPGGKVTSKSCPVK